MRKAYVASATESYESLHRVISQLTKDELYAALALEASTRRRDSLMHRMIGRIVRIESQALKQQLLKEYTYAAA